MATAFICIRHKYSVSYRTESETETTTVTDEYGAVILDENGDSMTESKIALYRPGFSKQRNYHADRKANDEQPKYARNKNILVIGGSGSGKTRFFVKQNLMQIYLAVTRCLFVFL